MFVYVLCELFVVSYFCELLIDVFCVLCEIVENISYMIFVEYFGELLCCFVFGDLIMCDVLCVCD